MYSSETPIKPLPGQTVRCGIYCRISRDDESDMLGVRRQEKDARQTAERKGWAVAEVYVDDDISAWSGKKRPAYLRMLADIEAGAINAVVVYDLDRLHRLPRELEHFFDVCDKAGVTDLATASGDTNLGSHDGQFTARIMGAMAKKSSDDTSRRIKRKNDELAEAGLPHGVRAFGYNQDRMTLHPVEAPIVREMIDRLFAGDTLNAIAKDLNQYGIAMPQGGRGFSGKIIRTIITNPRIAGYRVHRGVVIGPAAWEPIIDQATHEKIVAYFADPTRPGMNPPRRNLLTGLVFCALCGSSMTYTGKLKSLVCGKSPGRPNCGSMSVRIDPLEQFVTESFFETLRSMDVSPVDTGADADDAVRDVESLNARMKELSDMFAAGEINRIEWMSARRGIEDRLGAARRKLNEATKASALSNDPATIEGNWREMSIDRKRLLLGRYIDRIIISSTSKGRVFNTGRIKIVWAR